MEDKTNPEVTTETKAEETTKVEEQVDYAAEMKKLREENEKLKKAQTNASKDASDWKAKYRATQDEATRVAEEQKEILEQIKAENESLKRAQNLATHKAGWLGLGFSNDLADNAAEASVSGDFNALMDIMKKFLEVHDKDLKAASIRAMPAPASGTSQSITKEEFDSMGYRERAKLFTENPELYKQLNGK